MKKVIAIICLLALILAGCGKEEPTPTEPETTESTQPTETVEIPEQIVQSDVSPLTGTWQTTVDKGQYMATLYYLQTGGDQ